MNKLLNCPFCGGEAELKCNTEMGGTQYQILCTQCPATVGRYWFWKEEDVIEAWNTRKPMEKIKEELKLLGNSAMNNNNLEKADAYDITIEIIEKGGMK